MSDKKNGSTKIKIKDLKGDYVEGNKVVKGLNEEETVKLVGESLEEKLEPIARTVFDTANTAEQAKNAAIDTAEIAKRISEGLTQSYKDHLKAGWNYLCFGKFNEALYEFGAAMNAESMGHEAHFGFALATHRIQLLDIGNGENLLNSFNKIPVYCEIAGDLYLEDAFEKDVHYQKALEYSANYPQIQNKYLDCATKIKKIIQAFKQFSRENKRYDCFICAKVSELDENGNPIDGLYTEDCEWAKKLHKQLQDAGLNPFFSENDIGGQEKVAATEYEALILYALIHSKCMVIVCSEEKYFRKSVFMQNEYNRFVGFLRENNENFSKIYLVRKRNSISLPGMGTRQDCIRTDSNDEGERIKDLQKVVKYVKWKVHGETFNPSARLYCIQCDKDYARDIGDFCPKCTNKLISYDEYEVLKNAELQEKQREIEKKEEELENKKKRLNINQPQEIPCEPLNGVVIPKKVSKYIKDLYKRAIEGNMAAQYELGECYRLGCGVKINDQEAIKWYYRAAKSGNAKAEFYLGFYFDCGEGIEENPNEAAKWYHLAAQKGNASAQNNLGKCYQEGKGVKQDWAEAVMWYKQAAQNGNLCACANLGECYYYGELVEKNYAEAVTWYEKCATDKYERYKRVWQRLAKCYEEGGYGLQANPKEAKKWKRRSVLDKIMLAMSIGSLFIGLISLALSLFWRLYFSKALFPSLSGYVWVTALAFLFVTGIISLIRMIVSDHIRISVINKSELIAIGEFITIFFCLVCFVFMLSIPLFKQVVKKYDFQEKGILYKMQEDGSLSVSNAERNIISAEIPNELNGYIVTIIEKSAFENCYKLETVTIPESITNIDYHAFNKCTKLTSIFIPSSVTTITYNAFDNCENLTIYCQATQKPSGWASNWNVDECPVVWGATSIS